MTTQRNIDRAKDIYVAQNGALAGEVLEKEKPGFFEEGGQFMELLGKGLGGTSAFLKSPYTSAGLSLLGGYFQVKSRIDTAKTKAETYRKKGERAVEKARREAKDIEEENLFKEAEAKQGIKSTGFFSGEESFESGTLFQSVLMANRRAAEKLAADVIKEGGLLKQEYDEAARATEKASKYGAIGDIVGSLAGAAGSITREK